MIAEKKKPSVKAQVDRQFLHHFVRLLRIIVPSYTSPEAGFLALVAGSLVARSLCDIWMISHSTKIER